MDRVLLHLKAGVTRLEVSLGPAAVVLNPEPGKSLEAVAARIAKKLRQAHASFQTSEGCPIVGDCTKLETGHVLKVGESVLRILLNPPVVRDLAVPGYPMAACAIMPTMSLENTEAASWRWLRGEEEVGCERFYVPTDSDVGFTLLCQCTPIPDGDRVSVVTDVVKAGPEVSGASSPTSCGDFRVLTYNLLADYNLKPDLASGDPDYLHLRPEERDFQYRRQLLLQQVVGFSSDILCFQEVDRDTMYGNFLHGQLLHLGYEGVYSNKVHTSTPVGNAVFWRRSSWSLVASEALDLTQGEDIHHLLEASPSLKFAMSKTTTVANLVVLRDSAGRGLAVANLHLFGDPGAPHIRLLQTYLVLRAAERCGVPLLLCGDFNCGPEAGVCELLTVGCVDEVHPDWIKGRSFEWGALCGKRVDPSSIPQDQWCAAMQLSHSFALSTAGVPEYTFWNGRRGFVVDHIFADVAALQVRALLPVPPLAFAREHGVASTFFPSDHAALVADLCWNS